MKITFLGHAAVLLEGSKSIIIDPFITKNPVAAIKLSSLPDIDFVLATHDHFDHLGDGIKIAKKNKATLVAIHEVATSAAVTRSKISAVGMNIGGTYEQDGVKISMTYAMHSAKVGSPCGYVVEMDKKRVYHAGDTALFSDMALIPKVFGKIDVALLPIGGHYTMDEKQAKMAVRLIRPHLVVPVHYNTWPIIKAEPSRFKKNVKLSRVKVLMPGKWLES